MSLSHKKTKPKDAGLFGFVANSKKLYFFLPFAGAFFSAGLADAFLAAGALAAFTAGFFAAALTALATGSVLRAADAGGADAASLAASCQFGKNNSIRWRDMELARRQRGQCAS